MSVFLALLLTLRHCARSGAVLQLEVLALRHQLEVRSRPRRLRLAQADRLLWAWLTRVWKEWRVTLVIVQSETHALFRCVTVNCRCSRLGIRMAGLPTDQRRVR